MLLSQISDEQFRNLETSLPVLLSPADSLEEAGEILLKKLVEEFQESIILTRLFTTFRYSALPTEIQKEADRMAALSNSELNDNSIILTLLASTGIQKEWNNRRHSENHKCIPLVSTEMIARVPMISSLLEQMDFKLAIPSNNPGVVAKTVGKIAGTFFVEDATSTKNARSELIISDQDFVREHSIQSVFGFGGDYFDEDNFMVVVCFLRDKINREQAIEFNELAKKFISSSTHLILNPETIFRMD